MAERSYISLALLRSIALLIIVLTDSQAKATGVVDTLQTDIYYLQGQSVFMPELPGNTETFNALQKLDKKHILSIDVISSASPEGNTLFNKELSANRSVTTMQILDSLGLQTGDVSIRSIGIDWNKLAAKLDKLTDKPGMAEAAAVIRNNPEWIVSDGIVVDSRKLRLQKLDGGAVWALMLDSIFPSLRVSHISISFRAEMLPELAMLDSVALPIPTTQDRNKADIIATTSRKTTSKSFRRFLALRTNLLYDAAAIPNLGLILPLPKGWSVSADAYYADWSNRADNRYWRIQGTELAVRKQLASTQLKAWFLELYSQLFRWNICLGETGKLSSHSAARFFDKPSFGIGFATGYSVRLSHCINLDFSLGVGYINGQYQTYKNIDGHKVWQSTRHLHYFGPSQLAVSLVWLIRKGGKL